MTNNRQKGKRGERALALLLRPFFPDIKRNAMEQSQGGGSDFQNTGIFDFECKYGKAYKLKKVRDIITQTQEEGNKNNLKVAYIKPEREEGYFILPEEDFLEIMGWLKKERVI